MKKTYYYIGTDPGGKGGVCILNSKDDEVRVFKMPDTCAGLWSILDFDKPKGNFYVIHGIERLWPRQQRSARSTFMMGIEAGSCEALHTMLRVLYRSTHSQCHIIAPQTWQAKTGCPKRPKTGNSDKDYSQHKKNLWHYAESLYPQIRILKDVADSVLIAHYFKLEHEHGQI